MDNEKIKAAPAARKLAKEYGIDLADIAKDTDQRITVKDVISYVDKLSQLEAMNSAPEVVEVPEVEHNPSDNLFDIAGYIKKSNESNEIEPEALDSDIFELEAPELEQIDASDITLDDFFAQEEPVEAPIVEEGPVKEEVAISDAIEEVFEQPVEEVTEEPETVEETVEEPEVVIEPVKEEEIVIELAETTPEPKIVENSYDLKKVTAADTNIMVMWFTSGEEKVLDFSPLLNIPAFASLKDPAVFTTCKADTDKAVWDNGCEIASKFLYETSIPIEDFVVEVMAKEKAQEEAPVEVVIPETPVEIVDTIEEVPAAIEEVIEEEPVVEEIPTISFTFTEDEPEEAPVEEEPVDISTILEPEEDLDLVFSYGPIEEEEEKEDDIYDFDLFNIDIGTDLYNEIEEEPVSPITVSVIEPEKIEEEPSEEPVLDGQLAFGKLDYTMSIPKELDEPVNTGNSIYYDDVENVKIEDIIPEADDDEFFGTIEDDEPGVEPEGGFDNITDDDIAYILNKDHEETGIETAERIIDEVIDETYTIPDYTASGLKDSDFDTYGDLISENEPVEETPSRVSADISGGSKVVNFFSKLEDLPPIPEKGSKDSPLFTSPANTASKRPEPQIDYDLPLKDQQVFEGLEDLEKMVLERVAKKVNSQQNITNQIQMSFSVNEDYIKNILSGINIELNKGIMDICVRACGRALEVIKTPLYKNIINVVRFTDSAQIKNEIVIKPQNCPISEMAYFEKTSEDMASDFTVWDMTELSIGNARTNSTHGVNIFIMREANQINVSMVCDEYLMDLTQCALFMNKFNKFLSSPTYMLL